MCNKRYIRKPQNKEIRSVSRKTDSPMSLLSCSRFSGWIPIWSMDAIPRNPSYSASFSPLIFLLHYPFLISLYLWLNMYFSKDADSIPPPLNHPGSTGAGPRQGLGDKVLVSFFFEWKLLMHFWKMISLDIKLRAKIFTLKMSLFCPLLHNFWWNHY